MFVVFCLEFRIVIVYYYGNLKYLKVFVIIMLDYLCCIVELEFVFDDVFICGIGIGIGFNFV